MNPLHPKPASQVVASPNDRTFTLPKRIQEDIESEIVNNEILNDENIQHDDNEHIAEIPATNSRNTRPKQNRVQTSDTIYKNVNLTPQQQDNLQT